MSVTRMVAGDSNGRGSRDDAHNARPDVHAHSPLPTVLDLPQAVKLLGLGRTTAYKLVRDQQWPTPVLRLGRLIKIPTRPLLDLPDGTGAVTPDSKG